MSRTNTQEIPLASSSKTLYTPVFYATPPSSVPDSQTSTKPIPKAYLDRMSKQHIALATKVQEVPASDSSTPEDEEQSAARVEALRKQVVEAFEYARGDPADGKWAAVCHLLKLNATRGRTRWLDVSTKGKEAEEPSFGWINAENEEEWNRWESKAQEESRVKNKVENWQREVEAPTQSPPVVTITQDTRAEKPVQDVPTEQNVLSAKPKRTSSSLGFAVVKRASRNIAGKPKGSAKASANNAAAGPSGLSSRPLPRASFDNNSQPSPQSSEPPLRPIHDLSESSFLPPSFPSQLETSTPNKKRHKPEPIPLAPPSSSPLPTPPSLRVYGRQRTMSSLSELPSTPIKHSKLPSATAHAQVEKRARSVTPPHAVKKARVEQDSPQDCAPITPVVTPQRAQLPRLTDLIASAKKSKAASRKARSANTSSEVTPAPASAPVSVSAPAPVLVSAPTPVPVPVSAPVSVAALAPVPVPVAAPAPAPAPVVVSEPPHLPAPESELESISEAQPPEVLFPQEEDEKKEEVEVHKEVSGHQEDVEVHKEVEIEVHKKVEIEVHQENVDAQQPEPEPSKEDLLPAEAINEDLTPGLYDYTTRLTNDEDDDDRDRSSAYNLIASPARSLSSLAASDSDSDSDHGLNFAPPFTSTQVDGKEKALGWLGYNSQFDVDGKVDMVSKFMEKDVDVDFAGWLRDPSVEPPEESQ